MWSPPPPTMWLEKRFDPPSPPPPPPLLLNWWSGWISRLLLLPAEALLLLFDRKGRLNRLPPVEELLFGSWSENCISPWNCLSWSWWYCWLDWSWLMKKDAEDCAGRKEEPIGGGERRWSKWPVRALPPPPSLKMSAAVDWLLWWWWWSGIWGPTTCWCWWWWWDKARPVLLVPPYKLLPRLLKLGWCLALSWASASQKALWVIKLSLLHSKLKESHWLDRCFHHLLSW